MSHEKTGKLITKKCDFYLDNYRKEEMNDNDVVLSYKRLARVERAFRTLKTSQLKIRPIYHWNAERVKGHALLCMLAYYVEWHLRKKLAPLLFDETDPEAAEALRENPVVKAKRSPSAKAKESRRRTPDDLPVLSFKGLLKHLATYTWIQAASRSAKRHSFVMYAQPSPLQEKAFELLGMGASDNCGKDLISPVPQRLIQLDASPTVEVLRELATNIGCTRLASSPIKCSQ